MIRADESYQIASYVHALNEFETAIGHKLKRDPAIDLPFEPGSAAAQVRCRLVMEEAEELCEALMEGTIADVAKESADLKYVTFGTDVTFGIPPFQVFELVHANNMGRLTGATYDGQKVIKPVGYPKVDLREVLKIAGLL